MLNLLYRILTAAIITVISTTHFSHAQGFLKAKGQKIVNDKGENVLLRGMGLGGWMLQEGYMLKIPGEGQQHKIKERISDIIGTEQTQKFYDSWLSNHTTRRDIDSLKRWGFNSVRLPMHYNLYTLPIESEPVPGKHTWLDKGFAMTDSLLAWCKANQMYLILDLHAAPGGQGHDFNISDADDTKPLLWENALNQEKTVALWKKLAERYVNEPWIGGYDILNEPNYGFEKPEDRNGLNEQKNEPLKKLLVEITKAIREIDKNHIIIIEGNGWGNNYRGMLPAWDNNMVLSFHKYWNNNDVASIQNILDTREKENVPVWLGETGENSNVWFTSCIALLEKNNIGWAWWPLKKLGNNNPLQIPLNPGYQELLTYWEGKGPKPEASKAVTSLMQYASDLKIENNIFHKDVIDAMMRQPHSNLTMPFRKNLVGPITQAVDYDLGKINHAYYDLDSANYWVVQGQRGGNQGHVYRNDGVDIMEDDANAGEFYVGNIEANEWLLYTINANRAGAYQLNLQYRAVDNDKSLSVKINGSTSQDVVLTKGMNKHQWQNSTVTVQLKKGTNKIKIFFHSPEMMFKSLQLKPGK